MISDLGYDILTTLQSKLEAVWAYEQYLEDCEDGGDDALRQLFEEIKRDDERHVERLRAELERMVKDGRFR